MGDQIESIDIPILPRSAREKIEARIKAETESPKNVLDSDRRQFLKASAISGSMALLASGGLVRGGTEVAEAAPKVPGHNYAPAPAYAPGNVVNVVNGADAVVKLLQAYDTEYIFWGTDDEIAPIADKLTPMVMANQAPHPIMGLNEFAAIAMAHGYAAASEKTAVAIYGACQGPMNSHGALYNAYMSRAPIVVIAALNPNSGLPYSGQYWTDPGDLVREYTKWTNHFPLANNIPSEMIHAFATAEAHPQGPVLISTFHNTWLDPMAGGQITLPNPAKLTAGRASVPNAASLSEVAALLVNARNPIIIAGDSGRRDAAFKETVRLAELLGAGVVETKTAFTSFPWNHPLHIGFSSVDPVKDADVVFTLEAGAPVVPATCKLVSLDVDPIRAHALSAAGRIRETDARLLGETSDTLSALIETIGTPSAALKAAAATRTAKWKDYGAKLRAGWRATAARHLNDSPISEWRLADEVNKIMSEQTILFGWTFHSRGRVVYPGIATNYPKSYIYTLGGAHLGQTLYGAIGAACARPEKQIIAVSGDLEWHMGHGAAALWSAAHHSIPILYIIVNNHEMSTTKAGQIRENGEGSKLNNWWAQQISPPMADYSTHAKGLGIYGECVKEPDQVGPALKRALDAVVKDKKPALLDVWVSSIVNVDGLP